MDRHQLGLCVPSPDGESQPVYSADTAQRFGAAWWYNYRADALNTGAGLGTVASASRDSGLLSGQPIAKTAGSNPARPRYVPMLWDDDDDALWALCNEIALCGLFKERPYPGLILLWNEPERKEQADMTPEAAALALRQWWKYTHWYLVPVAVGGVNVSVHHGETPYEWLDAFEGLLSDAERRQIAYWHIHAYGTVAEVDAALTRFEEWMHERDVVRPVILSETASSAEPAALMRQLCEWIRSKRLHGAAWFSTHYPAWNETGLLDADGELTICGEAWSRQGEATVYLPRVSA